jgi:hypothetical protein
VLTVLLALQLATVPPSAPASEQERVTATEVLAYAEWRNCVLKATHHLSRRIKDHGAVADGAIEQCGTKAENYRSSLTMLAQLYQLKDPGGFARRNVDQGRKALRDMALKELQ